MTVTSQPEQTEQPADDLDEIIRALKIAATMSEDEAGEIIALDDEGWRVWPPLARAARFRQAVAHRVRLRAADAPATSEWKYHSDTGQWHHSAP